MSQKRTKLKWLAFGICRWFGVANCGSTGEGVREWERWLQRWQWRWSWSWMAAKDEKNRRRRRRRRKQTSANQLLIKRKWQTVNWAPAGLRPRWVAHRLSLWLQIPWIAGWSLLNVAFRLIVRPRKKLFWMHQGERQTIEPHLFKGAVLRSWPWKMNFEITELSETRAVMTSVVKKKTNENRKCRLKRTLRQTCETMWLRRVGVWRTRRENSRVRWLGDDPLDDEQSNSDYFDLLCSSSSSFFLLKKRLAGCEWTRFEW